MKQRLSIAQAIINDPQILLLDEPTTGLDPIERLRLKNLLRNLSKNKIIIISCTFRYTWSNRNSTIGFSF